MEGGSKWTAGFLRDAHQSNPPMTARQIRNLTLAVAASLLLVCALPPPFAGLVAFVGGFTALMLWLQGIWGTPKFVRAARRAASLERRIAEPHPEVPVRKFMNGQLYSTNHHVYSREDVITIGEKLPEFTQLMEIVETNARFAVAPE